MWDLMKVRGSSPYIPPHKPPFSLLASHPNFFFPLLGSLVAIERFQIHSVFGYPVHSPWLVAIMNLISFILWLSSSSGIIFFVIVCFIALIFFLLLFIYLFFIVVGVLLLQLLGVPLLISGSHRASNPDG